LLMRCEVCGRQIREKPLTRKTCCVNKLYVFCSEACLKNWSRRWLSNQEQVTRQPLAASKFKERNKALAM